MKEPWCSRRECRIKRRLGPHTAAIVAASERRTAATVTASERRITGIVTAAKDETIEAMRGMPTEILRGIERFARGNYARMHRKRGGSSGGNRPNRSSLHYQIHQLVRHGNHF